MKTLLSLLLLLTLLTSCCRKDFFQAPSEFQPYVDAFVAAGLKRGKIIQPEKGGLTIKFGILENHQLGKSRPNDYPKTIIINQEIWQDLDTFQRRALIFHELAHCILLRKHRNQLLANGECASLLTGKENDFHCQQNLYSNLWWDYYVDELFNPKIASPSWYKDSLTNYQQNFQKTYLMDAINPTFQLDSTISIDLFNTHFRNTIGKRGGWFFLDVDTTNNYQVEVSYQTNKNDYKTYQVLWMNLAFTVTPTHLIIASVTDFNKQRKWNISSSFYKRKLMQNTPMKKLTIRKVNHLFYFFFNEKIVHLLEVNYPKRGEYWWNKTIDKSVLKTNFIYKNETYLKIEVAYLN